MKIESDNFTLLASSLLEENRDIVVTAKGGSMLPTIPNGTRVKISPIKQRRVQLGDVILFRMNGVGTAFHRVSLIFRFKKKKYIQTWGDNLPLPDTLIKGDSILGKVVAYEKNNIWHNLPGSSLTYMRFFFRKYALYYTSRLFSKFCDLLPKT